MGDRVTAFGNPYIFSNILTGGYISQIGRLILESEGKDPYLHLNIIQTDALINLGNSGGHLINLKGQVIGMNTATINTKQGGAIGLGFAITSKTLIKETPKLIENGSYHHPWLGISVVSLTKDMNREIGLKSIPEVL